MQYLPNGAQMKAADKYTINEHAVPSQALMERAANAVVQVITEEYLDVSKVLIVCGTGNNAGDGLLVARMLSEKGFYTSVAMLGETSRFSADAAVQYDRLDKKKVKIYTEVPKEPYTLYIDAVFGAGLNRKIEGRYYDAIKIVNERAGMKLAIDIPSGISSVNGEVLGIAFKSDITVAIQMAKLGTLISDGVIYSGKVHVCDIGITDKPLEADKTVVMTLDNKDYRRLLPKRPVTANKGTFGKVLVIAGSRGMAGAAFLNSYAAYKAGAGLVRIYTHEDNRSIIQTLLPEAIISTYKAFDKKSLKEALLYTDVIVMGSGLGLDEEAEEIVSYVLGKTEKPCIIDGDAITIISRKKQMKDTLHKGSIILTPHMREMERLLGKSINDIKSYRSELLYDFCRSNNVTCVLKDFRTLIADGFTHPVLNTSGSPAMSKGGSGDVLAGIIGGLIAQKLTGFDAAVLGTYIHGRAGEAAASKLSEYSVLARDIIENIGHIMTLLLEEYDEEI